MIAENTTLIALQGLLDRYRIFSNSLELQRSQQFKDGFDRIAKVLKQLQYEKEETERRDANRFNLFDLFDARDKEVTVHSALLADLLNPRGSHGQGGMFLQHFLYRLYADHCEERHVRRFWRVQKEKVTSFGKLDVALLAPELRRCIIIENKITASDQLGQLARYYRWLQSSSYKVSVSSLIYLTPDGRCPNSDDTFRINGQLVNEAKEKVVCMSYKTDIAHWLEDCLQVVCAPRLRESLVQYLEVVKALQGEQYVISG